MTIETKIARNGNLIVRYNGVRRSREDVEFAIRCNGRTGCTIEIKTDRNVSYVGKFDDDTLCYNFTDQFGNVYSFIWVDSILPKIARGNFSEEDIIRTVNAEADSDDYAVSLEAQGVAVEAEIEAARNIETDSEMRRQTIGVEIEFTGLTRTKAALAIAEYFGTPFRGFGLGYDAQGTIDYRGRKWMIMRDTSIHTGRHCSSEYQCELVTPILKWNDLETLKGVVNALKAAGGVVNESCGLHVHIGAFGFTARGLRNLVNIVGTRDKLFYKVFGTYERRKSYCDVTDTRVIRELNSQKPETLDEVKKIWYNGRDNSHYHYDESRYTICNLHAFFSKGTIEFRVFNSTLEADEVLTAVHFTTAIVNFAKSVSHTVYTPEALATFKSDKIRAAAFFNKIGLIGDEFKTTRRQLLKNLRGGNDNVGSRIAVA